MRIIPTAYLHRVPPAPPSPEARPRLCCMLRTVSATGEDARGTDSASARKHRAAGPAAPQSSSSAASSTTGTAPPASHHWVCRRRCPKMSASVPCVTGAVAVKLLSLVENLLTKAARLFEGKTLVLGEDLSAADVKTVLAGAGRRPPGTGRLRRPAADPARHGDRHRAGRRR